MKKFNITVNGTIYEVEVEEVSANTVTTAAPVQTSAPAIVKEAPKAELKPAPAAQPAVSGGQGSIKVNSPMPGSIVKVNVQVGQKVAKGDIVCVLEAMKMENEIPAPQEGTIASVNVQSGASVNTGDVLATLN